MAAARTYGYAAPPRVGDAAVRTDTADQWNLLARVDELPYDVLLFEARQTIRMHEPVERVETTYDPHARWRNLIPRTDGPGTVYQRQHCGSCTDEGCALLDAAKLFEAIVAPYVEPA